MGIGADEVLAAYRKIGGLPIRGAYKGPGSCFCPLTVVAYARGVWAPAVDDDDGQGAQELGREICAALGLDWPYFHGFSMGFDLEGEAGSTDVRYTEGWADGVLVARAVFSQFWGKPKKRKWEPYVPPAKPVQKTIEDDEEIPF